jgi:hypothetical protein
MYLESVVKGPLTKRSVGGQRKLRMKGCLKGTSNQRQVAHKGEGTLQEDLLDAKKYSEIGHRQTSYKCPLNGTKKRNKAEDPKVCWSKRAFT